MYRPPDTKIEFNDRFEDFIDIVSDHNKEFIILGAERLPLRSIFQNMTFIHYVQRLANVTKIAKFILPST